MFSDKMEIENYNKFIQQLIQSSKILKDHISKCSNTVFYATNKILKNYNSLFRNLR